MGVWFVGDIDYKCPSFFEPSEFGCNTEEYTHYFFHKSEIDKIKSVIQKYKDLLKQFGIDASEMNMDILMSMGIDDIQGEWNLKFEDALKVVKKKIENNEIKKEGFARKDFEHLDEAIDLLKNNFDLIKTYYYSKDIRFLANEKLLSKLTIIFQQS